MHILESLGDGWSIYLWLVVGASIIVVSLFGIRWAWRNEQFDEDIKYLVFTESDQDKMTPEEYRHSRKVLAEQIESRDRHLALQAESHRPAP
ncbi:MAG: hypothetical protein ABSH33_14535 [Steroidobacteraceae bacterium]|jgi:nitrogen fixation-related uncharacterized protein